MLLAAPLPASAQLALSTIQANAEKAAARKKELDAKAAAELAQKKEELQKAVALVTSAVEAAPATTLDAKNNLIEEIVCEVRNSQSADQISGKFGAAQDALTLKLGSVASDEKPSEKLAIQFHLRKDSAASGIEFEFLDLNRSDLKAARALTLKELGLETECRKQKRLQTLTSGAPQVNDQTVSKVVGEAVKLIPTPISAAAAAIH